MAPGDLADDSVGADRAADTDKRKDSARSNVEHVDSLDERDKHTLGSIRKGSQADGKDNPYSLDFSSSVDRDNEADRGRPAVLLHSLHNQSLGRQICRLFILE